MQTLDLSEIKDRIWSGSTRREDLVQRVTVALRDLILSGRLPPGTKLVAEAELARQLSVSRPSLREAIRILAHEGLIDVRHGIGSFVSSGRAKMIGSLELMRSMTDLIRAAGGKASCGSLTITREQPDARVRAALALPDHAEVAHIARVRLIDGRPFVRANEYLVLDQSRLTFEAISRFDGSSLYQFMRQELGLTISHSSCQFAAVSADSTLARLLEMPRRAPLLMMSEVHFDLSGRPVMLAVNHHNSDVVNFTSMRWGMPL